jgi:predicted TIM-barrel fold metal-dependent hydrolase
VARSDEFPLDRNRFIMERIDIHTHIGVDLLFYFGGGYPYALDLPNLFLEGSRLGLNRWVVFPMVTHTALSIKGIQIGQIMEGGDALEKIPYAWENRRLMQEIYELFPEQGRWTLPFAMVDPSRRPVEQVEELRKLRAKYRFYGLKIQATVIQSPIRALLDKGRALLDLAEEYDLPLIIHTSVDPADVWSQVSDILRVARARPQIRFCLAHSCRFNRDALNEIARLPNTWFDCSAHVIACRLAVQNHPAVASEKDRFASDYNDSAKVLADLANAYPDRLVWGSDAPFHSYVASEAEASAGGERIRLVCSYEEESVPLRALASPLQDRIACFNSLNFLGLKQLP